MNRGFFIVVEGPNRAGKTTFIQELAGALRPLPVEVIVTREPGGTPMGEGLRTVLKNSAMAGGAFATALIFNGGRKEHADKIITPALCRDAIVLCDRYYMSTEIFQGTLANDITPGERDILQSIHRVFPRPDLTVFLIPSAEVIARRTETSEVDRFEGNPREMAVYEEYAANFSKTHVTLIIRPTVATERQSQIGKVLTNGAFNGWLERRHLPPVH